jgi:3-deoxy-7-phosphoheptulonate synthase
MNADKLVGSNKDRQNSKIMVKGKNIGGDKPIVIAGPCSVESKDQLLQIAKEVKEAGADILRAMIYKPRTSPYSFQGVGEAGIPWIKEARDKYGLFLDVEATGTHNHYRPNGMQEKKPVLDNVIDVADIIQIGCSNMKSYGFLQMVAEKTKGRDIPVLLKRGEEATVDEFLLAAEYLKNYGNNNIILCLRGIRTFEKHKFQRYTPDIGAIPIIKRESDLPLIFDPSHSTGDREMVYDVSMAAIASGADGLIIECHYDPEHATVDGQQCITSDLLNKIIQDTRKIYQFRNEIA